MAGSTRNPWEENYGTEGDSASGAKPWEQSYQEPEKPKRTWGEAIKDTGAQLAEGVNTTLGAIPSVVAPQSKVAGFFRDNAEHWRDQQSDVLKGRIAETDKRIQEAGKDGVMSQIGTAASEYWNDPAQAARLVATNLPSMAATLGTGAAAGFAAKGVAAARGLDAANKAALAAKYGTTTAAATNAALNAGGARGEAFEDLQKSALAQGMTPEQAEQAGVSGSILPGVVGGVAGAISGKIGLEKALLGQATTGAAMRKAGGAFGAELAGEQIEELAPKVATNYQVGQIDAARGLTDDLGRTMVETAIGSGPGAVVAGGAAGMRTGELPPSPGAGEPTTSPGAGGAPYQPAPSLTGTSGAELLQRQMDARNLDPLQAALRPVAGPSLTGLDGSDLLQAQMDAARQNPLLDAMRQDPVRAAVESAANAGGALSGAALVGIDTGASQQMADAVQAQAQADVSDEAAKGSKNAAQEQPVPLQPAVAGAEPVGSGALSAEERSGLATTIAGRELAGQPLSPEMAGLQAQLTQVQQRAAENGSWNVPLMAQRKRLEDAIAKLKPMEPPAERQEAANAQAAQAPAPAAAPAPGPAEGAGAVEAAGLPPRGREGYDTPVTLDAASLKALVEKTRGTPLVDKPEKLEAWRNGTAKTDPAKFPIELAITPDGRLDVNDGRHRIALAAERGETVEAFIDGKDAHYAKQLVSQPSQPNGALNVPQAPEAQQSIAQQPQAGGQAIAGPAAAATAGQPATVGGSGVQAAGVSNAPTPQNNGAQAGPAQGAQGAAQGNANWAALTPEQRRRVRLEHEIATGQTNNGGVVASLRPSAIEKRKQELAAMGDAGKLPSPGPAEPLSADGLAAQGQAAPGAQGAAQGPRVILQNRNRSTPSSIAQMRSIAAKPDYGRLGFSRDFANGAPVVSGGSIQPVQLGRSDSATASNGRRIPIQYAVVDAANVLPSNNVDGSSNENYGNEAVDAVRAIAGNGRIAGLQEAYRNGNAAAYRQELEQDAALHGIDTAVIATMQQPVLVRVMPTAEVTADIGDISNTVGNLDLSAVEQANNDATRVSLDALQFAEDGGITPDAVRQFVRAMPQSEQGGLMDTNGQPTKQAVDRLSAAVFAKAYGNDDLVRLFAQAQDPEARNVLSALAQVAPKMARLEGAGALDIRNIVTQAAEIAVNARRQGVALARMAEQQDMAADPLVGEVLSLFARNARTVRPVVDALGAAADFAYTEATKPAEDMFGPVPRATRDDVINTLRPLNERTSQADMEQPAGSGTVQGDAIGQGADTGAAPAPEPAQAGRPAEDAGQAQGRTGPTSVNEPAGEFNVRQQFSLFGQEEGDQLQLFLDNGPVPSQAGAGAVAAQREAVAAIADMESVASILAKSLSRDFAARQKVRLVGHTVSSAADLALLAQVYRDPRFETFRLVFTDNSGRVVSQLGITSRLPASATVIVGDDMAAYLREVSNAAKKTGATSYYMLHNHPSGQATPSGADLQLTKTFARWLPGMTLRSHVVIDTNQYSVIDANGKPQFFQQDFAQPPQVLTGPLAGEVIASPSDVVRMAQSLQADAGAITLIATDAQFKVKAVSSIPAATLSGSKGLVRLKIARALMRLHSANVFAVGRDVAGLRKLGGIVVDALHVKDDGSVDSLASAGVIASKNLGAFPADRRARVSPDTTENFAYLRFDPSAMQSAGQKLLVRETADLFGDMQEDAAPQPKKQTDKAKRAAERAADDQAAKDENRKRIAQASVRAAAEFELGQDPLDSLTGQGSMFDDAPAQPASRTPEIRYELPPEKSAQQQGDESWMAAQSPSFKPTARQQLLMDAVAKALDDGAFRSRDLEDRVAQTLGVTPEQRARNSHNVEGGDFGYDVYGARKAVEAQRGNAKSREFAKALNLKPGDVLGTLVFNDGKVTTGVKVVSLNESGLIATITGKRGAATLNGEVGVDAIASAIDRAKERGKRSDGYAEFVESKVAPIDAAEQEPTKAAAPASLQDGIAQAQKNAARFEIGKSLTKEQRKQVLDSLVDVYKAKGAEREFKGQDSNGNDRYGYAHSPDLFEKSDITGAMVRYYVTLPDGRIAHPTELFPDVSARDIERMALEQEANSKSEKAFENAIKPFYQDFDSANLMAVTGQVVISKGDRFAIIPDRIGAVNQARQQGWGLAKATAPAATIEDAGETKHTDKGVAMFSRAPGKKTGKAISTAKRDEAFSKWSNNAPLVTSAEAPSYNFKSGEKIVVEAFHGTKRPDRIGGVFDPKRATSGPMAFFTSSPELASSYSTNKTDTSLADEDQSFENWFRYKPAGQRSEVDIARAWHFLTPDQKATIFARMPDIRTNDDGDIIYEKGGGDIGSYEWELKQTQRGYDKQGNPLKAAVETWLSSGTLFNDELEFVKVLKLAGFPVQDLRTDFPTDEFPSVFKTFISMQKPLVVSDMPAEVLAALEQKAKTDRTRAQVGADNWDKRSRTLREWVDHLNGKNGADSTYAWTSIPDKVTDVLKSFGYDGIVDWSGKGGGHQHPVYIPFASTQVKGAFNRGTYDLTKKDINFSRAPAISRPDSNARNVATQMLVDGLKAKWTRAPEIIVARNMQDPQVPQAVRDYDETLKSQGATGEARGFIYKGKVYLLSDQLKGPQQIAEVLFHEVLGHYGLRGAFGDSLDTILQQIGTMRRRDVVAKAREYGLFDKDALGGMDKKTASDAQIWAAMSPKDRLSAAEEVLAEMAQTQPNIGFVQRAIAAIRNWLRSNVPGFKSLRLTDADIIQAYILPARGFVTRSKETGAQSLERAMAAFSRGTKEAMTNNDVVGNQGGRSADDTAPGKFAMAGDMVDGLLVRDEIPNQGSIGSSIDDYTVLRGIREIPLTAFTQLPKLKYYSISEEARTKRLAEQIKASGEINPLIVVIDKEGPYVLEGGHRFDALREIGKTSFPALVVLDNESLNEPTAPDSGGAAFSRTATDQTQTEAFRRGKNSAVENKNAPTSDTPDAFAGRPNNGMQERAVRAASGSPELAQFTEAGSDAHLSTLRTVDVFGDGRRIEYYDDAKGMMYSMQKYPRGERWTAWDVFHAQEGGNQVIGEFEKHHSFADAVKSIRGARISASAKARLAKYGAIPNTWDGDAKKLAKALIDAGVPIDHFANSTQSRSKYIYLDDGRKIRLADHDLPSAYDAPDYDYRYGVGNIAQLVEQVTTSNNGAFDPTNPDIRFSRADLGSRAGMADLASKAGEAIKSVTVTNLKQRAGFKLTDYLGIGLQALGRRQIVDIYGDLVPLAEYNRLVTQMEADKNEGGAEADKLVTRWAELPDEGKLADLMHDATLAQIDPAKPYVDGDDKARYMQLKGRYENGLSDEAKQVYTDTRDAYQAHHAKVRSAIKERIERSELKGPRKAELLKQMDDEFFAAVKGVYFPLARFGQYAVTVKGADGKVESVSRAETKAEAEALRNSLLSAFPRDKGFTVGRVMLSKDFIADRDAVGRGFMTELYQVLDKQDMDAAQRAELEDTLGQLYLSSLPDLSWAKHGIHRKGTPGFSQDARRAYAQNMFHGSRYLAKLRYSDLMQDELGAMQKHVDDWREVEDFDQNSAQRVVDEMNKRHESLMNPKSNALSTALTSLGFVFHLGLSPASAMVNLSQTALVAYPIMGAKWGYGKASAALLKASAEAAKGKNDITASLNADERAAYDEAVRAGTIDVTMAHDLAGIAQGEDAGVMWKIRPVMRWASFLFHHAERFNRQVTFVASYRLAREAGADQKAAFEQATKATYDGHFDYGAANRPRVMQGNVAKVLLLFKQYGQNMVYTLARNAQQAIKGESPEVRAQARKALGGLLATHAAAAGVLGLPMVTTLLAAASMIGGDDDEPWDAQTALQNMLADTFGQKPAEVLAHGLSRLTPWDISGRVGLDRLIFPDLQEGLEGQRLAESAMAAALGPVAGIGVNVLKGAQHMGEGRYALGLEAMLPSALRGPVKAIRYANEGVQDKSGISILDEVSPAAVAGQALGFSPSQARNAQEGKSAVMAHDRALGERRQELLTKAAHAAMAKDAEALAEARKEIAGFNEKNPGRRITPLNITQSVRNRQKRIDQSQDGVYLPKNRRDAMEAGRFALGG